MTDTARLVLAVDSREVDRGQRSLDGLTKKSRLAEQETERLSRATDQLASTYRGLGNVLDATGAAAAVRAVVGAADTYSEMETQLRLVTGSQQELNDTFHAAYEVAQSTRGNLEGTIQLYSDLARSTDGLGLSSEDLLTVTRAVNQSFVVSGASVEESAGAISHLAAGIASGTLRSDELNSVLQKSPRLAKAISDGLGVTTDQLLELGGEGKITGEAITGALLKTADSIDREFQRIPRTVGQSLQQLRNDFTVTFGQTDISGFNEAIDDLRGVITNPNFHESAVALGSAVATLVGTVASGASEVVTFTQYLGEELASKLNGVASDDIARLERELAGLEKQLDASFLEKDIGLVFTSDEEIKRQIEEVRGRLEVAYDLQQNFGSGLDNSSDHGGGGPIKPAGGADGNDKATDSAQKRIQALELEADTLRMTSTEAALYQLKVEEGASPAQLKAAEAAYRRIEAYEAEQTALEKNARSRRHAAEILAEMDKERATDINAGEQLLEQYMSEEELLKEHHGRRLEVLEAARAADFDNQARWDTAIEDEKKRHKDSLNDLDENRWKAQLQGTAEVFGLLTTLMSSENRKMFEIGKAAAIAQGIINIPLAASNAFTSASAVPLIGHILGPIAATAAVVAQTAQLGAIMSTSFSGGGGAAAVTGGTSSVPAAPAPAQLDRDSGQAGNGGGSISITVNGSVVGATKEDLEDMFAEALRDKIDNKDYVLIDSNSRNGRGLGRR